MKKWKLNLMVEILICVMQPIIWLVLFAILANNSIGNEMADRLREDHLKSSVYAVKEMMDLVNEDAFQLKGDELYRGSWNLTTDCSRLDEFRENTGVDVTVFYGTTRRATTILDSDGNRILGTQMSDEVYQKILSDGYYFSTSVPVEGTPYYGAYQLVDDGGSGNEVILFAGISAKATHAIYSRRLLYSGLFMIGIGILCLIFGGLIARGIVKNIKASVADLNDVADGKLNLSVSPKMTGRKDEVGNIARSVDSLLKKFVGIVENLNVSSETLTDFSDSIRGNFASIDQSISNINAAIGEIAEGASGLARETQDVTEQMNDMGFAVERASENIEAARAGEQGKGFAVVADEVRKLAEQSKQSAEQIEAIVQQLIANSNNGVKAMDTVMEEIQSQYEKLDRTKEVFGQLYTEISNVTYAVEGIAGEIATINRSKDKVHSSLENLSAISQENAASTEETSATMEQLGSLVRTCDDSVSRLGTISDSLEDNVKKFTL